MDRTSSIIAALDAGKLPSQRQLNAIIDWILLDIIPSDPTDLEDLTERGRVMARDLTDVLSAYKQLGINKNDDNLVQDTLWYLSEGDLSATRLEAIDVKEASTDMNALRTALRNLLKTVWTNITGEGSQLLGDFASFIRLALADFAESFEAQAAQTKESLRSTESEIQRGERDSLGRKHKTAEEEREEADPRVKFRKTMDTVKDIGTEAIGAGQSVKGTMEDRASRTRARLTAAFYQICDRAQNDEQYKQSLDMLFSIASKWLNRTLDIATLEEATSLSTFIHDRTEDKHILCALINIRTLFERLAGGKSLDDVFANLRTCALDVKQDRDLKAWFDDLISHIRCGVGTPGYARSEEAQANHERLERRWKDLVENNSDAAQKWRLDLANLRRDLHEFQHAIADDPDLNRAKEAHTRFVRDAEESIVAGARLGLQFALEQASWFWQDIFNVYTQRVLAKFRNIPIPRTEYVDREVEFVLENLDISSLRLLPGHAYMRNITDIEITAPGKSRSSMKTAFGTLTHIRLQAMQLSLRDVSFYYKDKTSAVGPQYFTGIMQFDLPTQGLDVDFKFRLIPNTEDGLAERERTKRFFNIERVDVSLADDIKFDIKESNHPVIASVFKPVLVHRFRDAIQRTLEEHIRGVFEFADTMAFDITKRSEVFVDTGLGLAPSFMAAVWSEIGHLRKVEGGLLSGWRATGTGIVKEGQGEGKPSIAIGVEPQILSGEKHGPLGVGSEPLTERVHVAEIVLAAEEASVAGRIREIDEESRKRVQTFRESVLRKEVEEKKRPGWESASFDVV